MILTEVHVSSPIGRFIAAVDAHGSVRAARFVDGGEAPPPDPSEGRAAGELRARLAAYFDGEVTALLGVPVAPDGTAFQTQVWHTLQQSPPGQTMSYGALAAHLGLHGHEAARAVGAANAANPIALIIPCHRVIAADGRLLGYAWGVERKRWLLCHEADNAVACPSQGLLL